MAEYVVPIVAVVATVASTAYSIYSSVNAEQKATSEQHEATRNAFIEQDRATSRALATDARLKAEADAAAADEAARIQTARGEQLQAEQDRARRILSTQRAIYGATGIKMEGSPLLVQADTIKQSEENISRILKGQDIGLSEAYRFGLNKSEESAIRTGYLLSDISRATGYTLSGIGGSKGYNYQAAQAGFQGAQGVYNIGRTYKWW
jgi:hypothetical protein